MTVILNFSQSLKKPIMEDKHGTFLPKSEKE